MESASSREPLELIVRGHESEEPVAYACSDCGLIFSPTTYGGGRGGKDAAIQFAVEHCHKRCACGAPIPNTRYICQECWDRDQRERDLSNFQRAEKVHTLDYEGPVFWKGHSGSIGDGYFSSVDEVLDYCTDEGIEVPVYVWSCTPVELHLDVSSVLERAFDEHHEGARDALPSSAEEELSTLLKEWCEKQNIRSWQADYRKAVLMHDPTDTSELSKSLA